MSQRPRCYTFVTRNKPKIQIIWFLQSYKYLKPCDNHIPFFDESSGASYNSCIPNLNDSKSPLRPLYLNKIQYKRLGFYKGFS